jgi:hypothetical protein
MRLHVCIEELLVLQQPGEKGDKGVPRKADDGIVAALDALDEDAAELLDRVAARSVKSLTRVDVGFEDVRRVVGKVDVRRLAEGPARALQLRDLCVDPPTHLTV